MYFLELPFERLRMSGKTPGSAIWLHAGGCVFMLEVEHWFNLLSVYNLPKPGEMLQLYAERFHHGLFKLYWMALAGEWRVSPGERVPPPGMTPQPWREVEEPVDSRIWAMEGIFSDLLYHAADETLPERSDLHSGDLTIPHKITRVLSRSLFYGVLPKGGVWWTFFLPSGEKTLELCLDPTDYKKPFCFPLIADDKIHAVWNDSGQVLAVHNFEDERTFIHEKLLYKHLRYMPLFSFLLVSAFGLVLFPLLWATSSAEAFSQDLPTLALIFAGVYGIFLAVWLMYLLRSSLRGSKKRLEAVLRLLNRRLPPPKYKRQRRAEEMGPA